MKAATRRAFHGFNGSLLYIYFGQCFSNLECSTLQAKKRLFYAVNWNPHLQKWWNVLISFQGISFWWKAKTCTKHTVYRQVHIYLDRHVFFFLLLLLYITTTNFKYMHIYLNLYIHNCYVCCCFWLCTVSLSVLNALS